MKSLLNSVAVCLVIIHWAAESWSPGFSLVGLTSTSERRFSRASIFKSCCLMTFFRATTSCINLAASKPCNQHKHTLHIGSRGEQHSWYCNLYLCIFFICEKKRNIKTDKDYDLFKIDFFIKINNLFLKPL